MNLILLKGCKNFQIHFFKLLYYLLNKFCTNTHDFIAYMRNNRKLFKIYYFTYDNNK